MKLKYVGRAPVIEVAVTGVFVRNGDTADFPEDVAMSLLRQRGQWENVEPPKSSKSTSKQEAE